MSITATSSEQAHLVPQHVPDRQSAAQLMRHFVPMADWQVLVERYPRRDRDSRSLKHLLIQRHAKGVAVMGKA
jgi:hypothetical protein